MSGTDKKVTKRTIAYTRSAVGDAKQMAQQERIVREAAKQAGRKIDHVIRDSCSGNNLNRPGLERLLREVKAQAVNAVWVATLNRLGRRWSDQLLILAELGEAGVEVLVSDDPQSTDLAKTIKLNVQGGGADPLEKSWDLALITHHLKSEMGRAFYSPSEEDGNG